jgi:hypothetical protein
MKFLENDVRDASFDYMWKIDDQEMTERKNYTDNMGDNIQKDFEAGAKWALLEVKKHMKALMINELGEWLDE